MKLFSPLFLVIATLLFVSCASESEEIQEQTNETLLKSYTLTRDAKGKYSIDYQLKENTSLNLVNNLETDTKEVHLFSGEVAVAKKKPQTLSLENNKIQLGIFENGEESKSFLLEDEPIALAKGQESSEFLQSYSITDLGNDNYQFDFKVKEGISVWYEYNELDDVYEVHLKEGVSNGLEFSKTYVKTSDLLRVHFVNYKKKFSAKGTVEESVYSKTNKPRYSV